MEAMMDYTVGMLTKLKRRRRPINPVAEGPV